MRYLMKLAAAAGLCALVATGCVSRQIPGPTDTPLAVTSPAAILPGPTETPPPATTAPTTVAPSPARAFSPDQGIDGEALLKMLPEQAGFVWNYDGSLESGHEMALVSVTPQDGAKVYTITGTVRDVSAGEAGPEWDPSIDITYTVDDTVWIQQKNAPNMLESQFDRIEILRVPLAVGERWEQFVEYDTGGTVSLICALESAQKSGEQYVYAVRYEDKTTGYYERREITVGTGITAFERSTDDEEEMPSTIGYWILTGEAPDRGASVADWLPPLGRTMRYAARTDYAHRGTLLLEQENEREAVYCFHGAYEQGNGTKDAFVVRYYYDKGRGTVTEKAVSNERTGEAEVNSKLHHLVVLRFPLRADSRWVHDTFLDGKRVSVVAEVVECDARAGRVRVRYTVEGAEGYYENKYIEERVFEVGRGLTGFTMRLPGAIPVGADAMVGPMQVQQAVSAHMFGYSLDPVWSE